MSSFRQRIDEHRINELIAAMTLEEKVGLVHGAGTFRNGEVKRLGIPSLTMSDGPHGVRAETSDTSWEKVAGTDDAISYLPVGTALAATWNVERARDFGDVLGAEARARGKDVILGPGINIVRTPLCGRNFEYYGEDPYHVATMVVPSIQACQSHDVAADIKHFALNNQELDRQKVDVSVDERTLREIYLPGFEAAVKQGEVLTLMGAYNRFRGQYCCHHAYLLDQILKKEWGFDYLVVSDWSGVHETDEAAENGLDIEMGRKPEDHYLNEPYLKGLKEGRYSIAKLDDKVRRVLRVVFAVGLMGDQRAKGERNSKRHQQIAKRIADEALVLLKNDNQVLPFDAKSIKTLAVIGQNADAQHHGGGGSSGVKALYEVTPLQALRQYLGDSVEIRHVSGYGNKPAGMEPIGTDLLSAVDDAGIGAWRRETISERWPSLDSKAIVATDSVPTVELAKTSQPHPDTKPGEWCIRWSAELCAPVSGAYQLVCSGGDVKQLYFDGKILIDYRVPDTYSVNTVTVELEAGKRYALRVEFKPEDQGGEVEFGWVRPDVDVGDAGNSYAKAIQAAQESDAVLIFGGSSHQLDTEDKDRQGFELSHDQDELITKLLTVNPRTAVFLFGGSATALPWADQAAAIVHCSYPGMEGGNAIADVAFGAVNPSGKLPFTWARELGDYAAHSMGEYKAESVDYTEAWRIGYRWTDSAGPAPRFCFGHGLSYTTFDLDSLVIDTGNDDGVAQVEVTLRNTGARAGAQVVQLYLGDEECSVERPVKELKGFSKVFLEPGIKQRLRFVISKRDLSFWDVDVGAWIAEPGRFSVHLGFSAEDIRCSGAFEYQG